MLLGDLLSQILAGTELQLPAMPKLEVSVPRDLRNYKVQILIFEAVNEACKQAGLSEAGCQAFAAFVARRVAGFSYQTACGQQIGHHPDKAFDSVIGSYVPDLEGMNFYEMPDWSFLNNYLLEIQMAFVAAYTAAKCIGKLS